MMPSAISRSVARCDTRFQQPKRHPLRFYKAILPFVLPMGLLPTMALADDSALSVKLENDGFASSDDGHFTSGFELNWMFTPEPQSWTQRLATALPDSLIGEADRASYRLVHQIYTPNVIERRDLIEDDRPYAGLVYGGVSLYEDKAVGRWQQATDLHLDVGLVGPSSQADSIQREVHRVTDSDRPRVASGGTMPPWPESSFPMGPALVRRWGTCTPTPVQATAYAGETMRRAFPR